MISSEDRTAGPYTGTGAVSTYGFDFKIFDESELVVVRTDTDGAEGTLVLTTDYTVSLNANQDTDPGGSITLTSALTTGYLLTITSEVAATQATDLQNQGAFYAAVIEAALDKLTILHQQNKNQVDRSLKIPLSDGTSVATELPTKTMRASKFLAFDANGDVIASAGTMDSAVPVSTFVETLLDDTNAAAFFTTLGISAFIQTLLNDVDAAAARTTFGAAASGANTDITSVALSNTGLKIKDTNASHNLTIAPASDITANRTLNIATGDSDRTLTLSGNPTFGTIQLDSVASQAQMEAASSNVVAVTPANFRGHPLAVKKWVAFDGTGTPAIISGDGVATIGDVATGVWSVNFAVPFSSATAYNAATSTTDSGNTVSANYRPSAPGSPKTASTFYVSSTSGGTLTDSAFVCITFMGDES